MLEGGQKRKGGIQDGLIMIRNGRSGLSCGVPVLSACVCALLALPAGAAPAASPQEGSITLTGLSEATLGVSQLTAEGVQCGLDVSQIGDQARHILADAGLTLRDGANDRITVSAVTARVGADQCATAVMVGAYAKESFFSAAAGWVQNGYVVMWQRSAMVATPIGQHAAGVIDATRRITRQLLADWRAQNRVAAVGPAKVDQRLTAQAAATPEKQKP